MNAITQAEQFGSFKTAQRDILSELLADKRSSETRRAYRNDLKHFFMTVSGKEPTPDLIAEFLQLERFAAIGVVLNYKQQIVEQGLAEATVNRRLAAIKALTKYAQKIGKCAWSLEEIQGEKARSYRDTSGIPADEYQKLLLVPDRSTPKGARDYALLRLLWDNALRRGELSKCDVSDLVGKRLRIFGKGRGQQAEWVSLSGPTVEALARWLEARGPHAPTDPLFVSLDRFSYGRRLSGNGIYYLVGAIAEQAGVSKKMSPHRCRHSSITAAAEATGGDIRKVQKLSRHRDVSTVMVYVDAAADLQGEVSELLAALLEPTAS